MRRQILKLKKSHSTRAERIFLETLKRLRIPFRAKVKIKGREIDFLIGRYAIEIDSHSQDVYKNHMLLNEGYTPIHFQSWFIDSPSIEKWLKQLWDKEQERVYLHQQEPQ